MGHGRKSGGMNLDMTYTYFTDIVIACKPFIVNYFFTSDVFFIYYTGEVHRHYAPAFPLAIEHVKGPCRHPVTQGESSAAAGSRPRIFHITSDSPAASASHAWYISPKSALSASYSAFSDSRAA